MAVVGVEADEDVVFLGENVDGLGKHDGTEGRVVDRGAGSELAATGRDLDDAVGLRLREGLERAIGGGERGDVDGWDRRNHPVGRHRASDGIVLVSRRA